MDSSRTRFLLRALRPNGADDADPTFREALEQTHADPELGAWFAQERAVDRAFAAKLREVRAPDELRAQILQGVALSRRPRRIAVRRPLALASLAAAASLALLIYTLWPVRRAPQLSFDLVVTAAVRETADFAAPEFASDSPADIRAWFREETVPIPGALPGHLADQPTLGGSIVEWEGVRCSRVTFSVPAFRAGSPSESTPEGATRTRSDVAHLYTVPRRSCSSQGVGRQPTIATREGATIATWRDAENYYVFVARVSAEHVQALLSPSEGLARAPDPIASRERNGASGPPSPARV